MSHGVPTSLAQALERMAPGLGAYPIRVGYHDEVGSTNDLAARLAGQGADEGTVVLAGRQTAGRGRSGRSWHSPDGAGVYLSMIFRPGGPAAFRNVGPVSGSAPRSSGRVGQDTALLTLMAGVAVADAVHRAAGLITELKWPNDLVVGRPAASRLGRRKLAGILAEGSATGEVLRHVVLGIGINVKATAFPPELEPIVTSIETETGASADRDEVTACLIGELVRGRQQLLQGRGADILARWRALGAASFGRPVEWSSPTGTRRGTTRDVDESGALVVEAPDGVHCISSGEVTWL